MKKIRILSHFNKSPVILGIPPQRRETPESDSGQACLAGRRARVTRRNKTNTVVFLIGGLLMLFLAVKPAFSSDITITFSDTACSLTPSGGPIFKETDVKPLDVISRSVRAVNTGAEPAKLSIKVADVNFSESDPAFPLSDILRVTITEVETGTIVYGSQTIAQWKNDGYIMLSNAIPVGGERNYTFLVAMDNVGNDYQSLTLSFDITLVCEGDFGNTYGSRNQRSPFVEVVQVLGAAISRLPATGQSILAVLFSSGLLGLGIFLKNKRKK